MKLIHKDFDFNYDFKENKQGLLVVESPCLFRYFVIDILEGNEGKFVLSENNVVVDISKNLLCVIDYFNISINERKILTKLNEIIKNEVLNSELFAEASKLCGKIEKFSDEICKTLDYSLEYNKKPDITSLIKYLDLKFIESSINRLECLVDYLKINSEILGIRVFLFVNLMSYFNAYEISKLLEFTNYNKINILLLENKMPETITGFDMVYILDKDCCQISLNDL